ncbi:uncharacterized protein LOC108024999 [Drosophila biarmipes]|uniref:uncharacterized protein LOC108024999 n=1 Tax=Drosophila biarmipes TaxID=125945 RepID=UPI0007E64A32|nr:uncharacterized protein LOC108024999 [Drosophila biarmipes]
MSTKKIFVVFIIFLSYTLDEIYSEFKFTNFNCTSFDKKVGEFEYCYLKSINRSYKYISGKYKLYQIPFENLKVHFTMWKRLNGYKPFLYNITTDACKFLKNPKSSPVMKYVFESFIDYTNINHSCPYTNDLILEKLPIEFMNHRVTQILPIPEGDYLLDFRWLYSKSFIAAIKVYCTIS